MPQQVQNGSMVMQGKELVDRALKRIDNGLIGNQTQSSRTAKWMISLDDKAASLVTDFDDHAELPDWMFEASREMLDRSGGNFQVGSLEAGFLVITMKNDTYATMLQSSMNNNENIEFISIVRIFDSGDRKQEAQTNVFGDCKIVHMAQACDYVVFLVSIASQENTVHNVDSTTGDLKGQNVANFNYPTATSEA